MKSALISKGSEQTYVVIFDAGDEVSEGLKSFAEENKLSGAHLTAIGAFERVTLGFFDWERKTYEKIVINEQVEVASMIGDIALNNGRPKVHAHLVVAKRDGTAFGGHLIEAFVRPTLEVVVTEAPSQLQREYDETTGVALISLDGTKSD